MNNIYFIGAWILFTLLSAFYDYYIISTKGITNHTPRFMFRIMIASINASIYMMLINEAEIINLIILTALQGSIFWLVFDMVLNLLRGKAWNYIGSTAEIDKAFKGLELEMILVKLIIIILLTGLTIWVV